VQYLGDFSALLLLWIVLFVLLQSDSWIRVSVGHFWPVCLVLVTLIWFVSMRASRALAALPILQLKFVSALMRTHPSLMPPGDKADDEREKRRLRVQSLLTTQKEKEERDKFSRPSFRRVFGLIKKPKSYYGYTFDRNKLSFYERGEELRLKGSPSDLSISDVFAYKLVIAFDRLKLAYRSFLMLIRYAITGVPPM
jgi:hypothetical protein